MKLCQALHTIRILKSTHNKSYVTSKCSKPMYISGLVNVFNSGMSTVQQITHHSSKLYFSYLIFITTAGRSQASLFHEIDPPVRPVFASYGNAIHSVALKQATVSFNASRISHSQTLLDHSTHLHLLISSKRIIEKYRILIYMKWCGLY